MSELLERARNRARILNAAAAWGASEDGYLIEKLVERIEELEAAACPSSPVPVTQGAVA